MENISLEEARDFIAEVREENGGITSEDREYLEVHRPSALRALRKIRRQLADSIKIVVDNLYSKDTRFLCELIQNAEDNSYSKAIANGSKPFLAFKVYPDKIIADSNEDGFSKNDIQALCAVGKSTKSHSAGYIGEKGIGFKSVFKVAHKVHIQSGPFSFALRHRHQHDDDGLGMITPENEDAEVLPAGVRTRTTLTLLESVKFEELALDFSTLPDTLMFLNHLQQLSIEMHPPNKEIASVRYSKRESEQERLTIIYITKTSTRVNEETTIEQKFCIAQSHLQDLPRDEARIDKQGNSIDQATVILAFPLDDDDEPLLKPQHAYAFLPLRPVGFNFLIQADFITQANREDVVHSPRNQALLEGSAKTFAQAVGMFCAHPNLRYKWMRYLPDANISDEFWGTFWPLVRKNLETALVVEAWNGHGLYRPSQLRRPSESFVAEDGSPLLSSTHSEDMGFLSQKYTKEDAQILQHLGTEDFRVQDFVDLLEADVKPPTGSKWKEHLKDGSWRTRICKSLSDVFEKDMPVEQQRLRRLDLIPLCDGRWVSHLSMMEMWFPETNGVPIPTDLGLDLVNPLVTENDAWMHLLTSLGVKDCPEETVIVSIYKRYESKSNRNLVVLDAVSHLWYLYWFLPNGHCSLAPQVQLLDLNGIAPTKDHYLYFPDGQGAYTPRSLFPPETSFNIWPANFLHEDYLNGVDHGVEHNGRTWVKWLEEVAGVRRIVQLDSKGSNGLSHEFMYLAQARSNRLLGTMKHGWSSYRPQLSDVVTEQLKKCSVLLENGTRAPLSSTFLPLPKMKALVKGLHIAAQFPFIAMSEILKDEERFEWEFAKVLGIGMEDNLTFYVAALDAYKASKLENKSIWVSQELLVIYQGIQSRCDEDPDYVRHAFNSPRILAITAFGSKTSWLARSQCVRNNTKWLRTKGCLPSKDYPSLGHLFHDVLKIQGETRADVIDSLSVIRSFSNVVKTPQKEVTNATRSNGGSLISPFSAYIEKETIGNQINHFQSIAFMAVYKKWSYEELRLTDYGLGRIPWQSLDPGIKRDDHSTRLERQRIYKEACAHYDWLQFNLQESPLPEATNSLLPIFEDRALVYNPNDGTWLSPSQCVWADSSVVIPKKASIADTHKATHDFFTKTLEVNGPTFQMCADFLIDVDTKAQARAGETVQKRPIKEALKLLCQSHDGSSGFWTLKYRKILPVRLANGTYGLASARLEEGRDTFVIMDREYHERAFGGKVNVLDLSLEEIQDISNFLLAVGLESRFSSKLVEELTTVGKAIYDEALTKKVREKWEALRRCSRHYMGPVERPNEKPYNWALGRIEVYLCDEIELSPQIVENGSCIKGTSRKALSHIQESKNVRSDLSSVQIFLPSKKPDYEICLESDLPRRLCKYLGIRHLYAAMSFGAIFRQDDPAVISKVLANLGVAEWETSTENSLPSIRSASALEYNLIAPSPSKQNGIAPLTSSLESKAAHPESAQLPSTSLLKKPDFPSLGSQTPANEKWSWDTIPESSTRPNSSFNFIPKGTADQKSSSAPNEGVFKSPSAFVKQKASKESTAEVLSKLPPWPGPKPQSMPAPANLPHTFDFSSASIASEASKSAIFTNPFANIPPDHAPTPHFKLKGKRVVVKLPPKSICSTDTSETPNTKTTSSNATTDATNGAEVKPSPESESGNARLLAEKRKAPPPSNPESP